LSFFSFPSARDSTDDRSIDDPKIPRRLNKRQQDLLKEFDAIEAEEKEKEKEESHHRKTNELN